MIINYSVKNFYSVGEEGATINFGVDGNAPEANTFIDKGDIAGRISLIESVIGPNASGKTKLLQGIAFLAYLISDSYDNNPKSYIPFEPHISHYKKPSEISSKFTVGNRVFEYSFVLDDKKIIKEDLKEFSKTKERVTSKTLASRKWDVSKDAYVLADKEIGISSPTELRRNASMIASAMQKEAPSDLAKLIYDYWEKNVFTYNLWVKGNSEDSAPIFDRLVQRSLHRLSEHTSNQTREKVKQTLSTYDIGFNDFFKHETELPIPGANKRTVYGINHKFLNEEFTTLIDQESSGTKRMIVILDNIMDALSVKSGGIAVIDEIDAFLHPDIVEAFVDLFISPETNPNKAQLLFSTHNHRLLNSFNSRQIILVEKNK
ncbi:MAG: ATP-binding protein [Pseudomonas sp.]|nr:ATP-binding protein [Pseudomonas sp.]